MRWHRATAGEAVSAPVCATSNCQRRVGTEGRKQCEMCLALARRRQRKASNVEKQKAAKKARRAAGHCTRCGVPCEASRCPGCAELRSAQERARRAKRIPRAYVRGIPSSGLKCSRCVRATTETFKMCIRCREDRAKRAAQWRAKASGSEALMQDHHARSKR